MAEIENLVVRLRADIDDYNRKVGGAMKNTEQGGARGAAALQRVNSSAVNLNRVGGTALAKFAGIAGAAFSVAKIAQYAEQYVNLQNQIRTVLGPQEDLNEKTRELLQLSNDTRSSLDATVTLYARLKRNTEDLGLAEEELIGITETINQAFAISGNSAAESAGAIRQLSQAFASGVLRGDEFNSVAEQAPIILEAVAAATGRSRGELRDLAADGQISADVVIQSLQRYSSFIEEDFQKTNVTASQALERLTGNFTVLIGELDTAAGISQGAAGGITAIAESLETAKQPALDIIETVKSLTGIIGDEFSDEVELINGALKDFETELAFVADLFGAFQFAVITGATVIPEAVKGVITILIADFKRFVDSGRVAILEFRQFIAESLGQDDVAAILQEQIDGIGNQAEQTVDQVIENVTNRLAEARTFAADLDARLAEEGLARRKEQDEKEIEALRERLERERELKEQFAEEDNVSLGEELSEIETDAEAIGDKDPLLKKLDEEEEEAVKNREKRLSDLTKAAQKFARDDEAIGKQALQFTTQKASASILAYAAEGAEKIISQLGLPGIPLAGAVLAAGAALSSKVSGIGLGSSGGDVGADVGGAAATPAITTRPEDEPSATLEQAGGTSNGVMNLRFSADSGNELEEALVKVMNDGIRNGRIQTG